MNKQNIINLLSDHNKQDVENFISYLVKLETDEKINRETKKKEKANPWFFYKTDEELSGYFKKVNSLGLVLDGKHITIQSTGLAFDYIALKNKMLIAYPESLIDVQLVYEGDEIDFGKESGKIAYKHVLANPFTRDETKIIGAYCVIKNKRGEFLTTLNAKEIEKHRKTAKTDTIWSSWFAEMSLKTIIKKAVKIHFDDIYNEIIEIDNEENDLNNPINIELSWKQEIESKTNLEDLKDYYLKNKGKGKDFDKYIIKRKLELTNNQQG